MIDDVLGVFLGMFIFAMVVIVIMSIISYVIKGLFLTKIAKDNFIDNKWMAWVPILQDFYIGYAAGVMTYDMNFSYIYIGGLIVSLIGMFVGETMGIASIAIICGMCIYALCVITMYKIFKIYFNESAIWLTILAFLVPISMYILEIIIITKKDFIPPQIEKNN